MTEFDVHSVSDEQRWEARFRKSRDDRVVLARFLAA